MTDLYVPDDLDPGEITVCDNPACGAVTTWPTGYSVSERCSACERGWKCFVTLPEHVPGDGQS